jgi:hypothetical protein
MMATKDHRAQVDQRHDAVSRVDHESAVHHLRARQARPSLVLSVLPSPKARRPSLLLPPSVRP